MSNPTSNFGWQMPTPTDLVTDLPADFEVFGQAVDTSMADLKGGTTGQILSKASNTDMDFTWIANDQGDITAVNVTSPITGGGTSGAVTVGIQSASTSQSGAVQLSDSTSTTSSVLASTPTATKAAYDLAAAAIPKSTVTGKGSIVAATASSTPANLSVGNNGEALIADSSATSGLRWTATPSASNPVLNSGFNVWQRGTTITNGYPVYGADRWMNYGNGNGTMSRQATNDTTNLPFIQYCARLQRTATNTSTNPLYASQSFETINSIRFAGQTVTLSFYARAGANFSATSSNMNVELFSGTGTDQNLVAGFTGGVAVIATTKTLTTTWQRFTATGTVPTTSTQLGINLYFTPTGTAGAADYLEATGVQIDIGNVALPYRSAGVTYQQELAACQRYYWRGTGQSFTPYGIGNSTTITAARIFVKLPVSMRTSPTSIEYGSLALSDDVNAASAATAVTIATNQSGIDGVGVSVTVASGLTQYRPYTLNNNSTTAGYIGFSAEL